MSYRINFSEFRSVFAVPNTLVDDHLKLCGAVQLKVLLLLLREGGIPREAAELAEKLGLSPGDVRDALRYWTQAGLVEGDAATDDGLAQSPPPQPVTQPEPAAPIPSPTPQAAEAPTPPEDPSQAPSENGGRVLVVSSKPRLTRQEVLGLVQGDNRLRSLLEEVQSALEKPLTSVEMDTLVALYSYYGLAPDYILMVIHYCKAIGKCNMRYVEKTAASWLDIGVDSFEKAEGHIRSLMERKSHEGLVRSAFGIGDRKLIPSEQKFVESWFNDYHYDIPIIKLAYERTIENIGKLNFPYTHKILTSWHQKGIKTPKEASQDISSRAQERAASQANGSYDIGELEKRLLSDFINNK